MDKANSAEECFSGLVEALAGRDGVALGSGRRGFGSGTLNVDGRIFAMVSHGGLVLKLPRERVAGLLAGGEGAPFDAGKGRAMKEWIVLIEPALERSLPLAREAVAFVGGRRPPPRRP